MKKLLVRFPVLVFLLAFAVVAGQAFAAAPANVPSPPPGACYAFDNFPTDFLNLRINPGQHTVTGTYRQCVAGADPGTGSADVLVVGTIQDVPTGNTIPYAPFNSGVLTQIALTGSIASGNFDGTVLDKASRCWLHLVFQDSAMTTGRALGACEWFTGSLESFSTTDRFNEPIHQIACSTIPTFSGTCSAP